MLVLIIDTSTPLVTAGVCRVLQPNELIEAAQAAAAGGGPVRPVVGLSERAVDDAFGHAERLMPLVTDALAEASEPLAALDAIVVGLGPGPFTGLRVGIATAEALGDALGLPVYGVPSHDGTAAVLGEVAGPFLVATDARRREVYVSAYDGGRRRIGGPDVIAPAALGEWLTGLAERPTAITGAGAALTGLELPVIAPGSITVGLATAAGPALVTGVVPGPLSPLYLRRPDATEPGAGKSVLT